MTLGSISCAKHLGGVRSIVLLSASEIGSLLYNPADGCFGSLMPAEGCEFLEVAFAENSASLEERVEADGTTTHKLHFSFRGMQSEVVDLLQRLSREGVVAIVELAEGEKFLVGYSPEASADYPLRLSEALLGSGSQREQRPSLSITLTSVDGSPSRQYVSS